MRSTANRAHAALRMYAYVCRAPHWSEVNLLINERDKRVMAGLQRATQQPNQISLSRASSFLFCRALAVAIGQKRFHHRSIKAVSDSRVP